MKVNFCNENINGVFVKDLAVGRTFCDFRRSKPDEMALYMVVDRNNDYVNKAKLTNSNIYSIKVAPILAINLATGQLKAYPADIKVFPVDVEVNVPRF